MTTTIPGTSRRRFLARAGGLCTALPFLRTVLPAARAADALPRRLVLLMQSNGTLVDRWRPAGTESAFTLPANSILEPLERHKANLLLVDAMKVYAGYGDQHFRGYSALWSGVSAVGTNREAPSPGGKTIDQHVATTVSAGKRYPTLNLAVMGGRTGSRNAFARSSTQPIGPESDPFAVYKRLFDGLSATAAPSDRDRLLAENRSVLDLVTADLAALSRRLVGGERAKLDAHLGALRGLERSLLATMSAGCRPAALDPGVASRATSARYFDVVEKAMQDVVVSALACDLTRVCTLEWGASNNGQVYHWLGHSKDHHGLSHAIAVEELVQINRWLAGRVGALMDALAAIPEGAGTMLDHTVIAWGNELGVGGPHKESDFPVLLAGGRALGVRTGRYLKLPAQLSTNHLLVTICRAMGLPDDSYGDTQYKGPIPGSLA